MGGCYIYKLCVTCSMYEVFSKALVPVHVIYEVSILKAFSQFSKAFLLTYIHVCTSVYRIKRRLLVHVICGTHTFVYMYTHMTYVCMW